MYESVHVTVPEIETCGVQSRGDGPQVSVLERIRLPMLLVPDLRPLGTERAFRLML